MSAHETLRSHWRIKNWRTTGQGQRMHMTFEVNVGKVRFFPYSRKKKDSRNMYKVLRYGHSRS